LIFLPLPCTLKPHSPERNSTGKGRMEAFRDGVLAIIITIMVLEMKAPTSPR
jgi:uncharacterized membrane protein